MASPTYPHLLELLERVSEHLPGISPRRMFGCDALFAHGSIYALIWKEGRIGVRLPEAADFEALLALEGAEPWKPGGMKMGHWVLVPEAFHDDEDALRPWVHKAHAGAVASPPKKKPASKAKPKATSSAERPRRAGKPAARGKTARPRAGG